MDGHIIEQNRPPLKKANNAKRPELNKPIRTDAIPKKPNIFRVNAGFSFPKKNPPIWMATHSANQYNTEMSKPEMELTNNTTPKAK